MSVVGVVLAGGLGRRMGGDKARVLLDGRPLLLRPLAVLAEVTPEQAVVAKAATRLPELPPGVAVWREPDEPRHPLTGIRHALRSAGGRAVLCCAVDLPHLEAATLRQLLAAPGDAPCVVPRVAGALEPLCALWRPAALPALDRVEPGTAMRAVVARLGAHEVPYEDPWPFTNVNTPGELARATRT